MARKAPPKKPVYPKQETPRRPKPARPVYPPGVSRQRAGHGPAGGRMIFDYDKETAPARGASPGQSAAPFVNTQPPLPACGEPRGETRRPAPGTPPAPRPAHRRPAPEAEAPRPAPPAFPERTGASQNAAGQGRHRSAPHGDGASQNAAGRGRPARPPQGKHPPKRPKKRPAPLTPGQLRRRRRRRAAVAGVLATVLLAVGLWVSAMVLFKISAITVETPEGDVAYDSGQITAAFGHEPGENLFGFSAEEAQQNLAAALPYLEKVEIRRRLPDTVVITVTPAVEGSVVESASGWAVLSQSYKVLRLEAEPPAGLVRVDGAQADAPSPGQPVKLTEEDKLPLLRTLLEKTAEQGLVPVSEIDLTNTLELSFLYQGRIRIVLGTSNDLDYKLKWAWRMVTPGETSDSLGEEERGTLDVSARGEDGLGRARWRAGVL